MALATRPSHRPIRSSLGCAASHRPHRHGAHATGQATPTEAAPAIQGRCEEANLGQRPSATYLLTKGHGTTCSQRVRRAMPTS